MGSEVFSPEVGAPDGLPSGAAGARFGERSPQAGSVDVQGVSKSFGTLTAVAPVSFSVPAGSLVTLLGPSGSGKTTILKIIAGFEDASSGRVVISGQDVTRTPPHKRNLGFVFQQYALFPHMSVSENVAYSLKMRGAKKAEIQARVTEALRLMRLSEFQDRRPNELSGGQQQRVALARAIVFRPPVLLMDEPMAALDKRLREEMQYEIKRLQRMLGITTILVTHDQAEALVMSDSIIVMNRGAIEQIGPPQDIYKRPQSEFVANFIGESNILRGFVQRSSGDVWLNCERDQRVPLVRGDHREGSSLIYVVRPESVSIADGASSQRVRFSGHVTEVIFSGETIRASIDVGLANPIITKSLARAGSPVPVVGNKVAVSWNPDDVTVIES